MTKKPVVVIEAKLKGEVYERVYGGTYGKRVIQLVVDLFNQIHREKMKIYIESIKEVEK